jgi:thiamine-monophosphate kinase
MATASGVGLVLDEAALLAQPSLVEASEALGADALDLALFGGEDYALVAASVSDLPGFRRVGCVRRGSGIVVVGAGAERSIEPRGFDHFEPSDPTGRRPGV